MATTYEFKARDKTGKLVKGKIDAEEISTVSNTLRERGIVPISITPVSKFGGDINIPGITDRVAIKSVAVMSRQFATMVDSGLTLVRSISVLAEQTEDKNLAKILKAVRHDIEEGATLSSAMAKHPKAFSTLYVAMIRAGEIAGNLDLVLGRLAGTVEKQVELRRTIRSAMTYPVVVVCVVVGIFFFLMIVIVPIFAKLFAQIGAKLPPPTQFLVFISNLILSVEFVAVVAVIIILIFAFVRYYRTEQGRNVIDKLKLRIPIFGKLIHKSSLARVTSTLSALVIAGVPLVEALEISADTAGNKVVEHALRDAREGVRNGRSLSSTLSEHDVMPAIVTHMVDTGEQTGALDALLEKIAEFYSAEVSAAVDALTSILEPLLIVFIGGIVGFIVVSLYLPMFSFYSALNGQTATSS
jgi:type IV pilus assembly protein PilC